MFGNLPGAAAVAELRLDDSIPHGGAGFFPHLPQTERTKLVHGLVDSGVDRFVVVVVVVGDSSQLFERRNLFYFNAFLVR